METLTEVFKMLMTIAGILFFLAIIIAIISVPFEKYKKRKRLNEILDRIAKEEEQAKIKETKKRTTKKKDQ